MRIISNTSPNNNSSSSANGNNTLSQRRPICAAEVFVLADGLRKSRAAEFSIPHSLSISEVRLLYYLRAQGEFIRRQNNNNNNNSNNAAAAQIISDVVVAIRDLCSSSSANNNNNNNTSSCVLTEDEIIQLIDLRVQNEVDLYKVIPDIDSRLGGEAKIAPLLALLQQLK